MRTRAFALVAVLSLVASAAVAQSGQRQLTYTGHSGVASNGYYVGAYHAASPGLPALDIYCTDFFNRLSKTTWTAQFTRLSDISGDYSLLGNTRLGLLDGQSAATALRYKQSVWLATQFATQATGQWGGIHGAIWNITAPGTRTVTGFPNQGFWEGQALAAALGDINWDYWFVVTDVETINGSGVGGTQEFLVYSAPEPGTIILMGTGLIGLIGAAVVTRRIV